MNKHLIDLTNDEMNWLKSEKTQTGALHLFLLL